MSKRKEMVIHRKDNLEALIEKYKLLDSISDYQIKVSQGKFLEIVVFINTPGYSYISANFGNITVLRL